MWDSTLILIAENPFISSLIPIISGIAFLVFKKDIIFRATGLLALIIGILVGGFLHYRWDSFSIHFSDLHSVSKSKKIDILFVGDSITCEGARPRGFITKIRSFLPCNFQIICQKGATSSEIIKLLETSPLKIEPSVIVAQSGINDLLNGSKKDQIFKSQSLLFAKLSKMFPFAEIMFCPIHPLKIKDESISSLPAHPPSNFRPWKENSSGFVEHSLMDDGIHLNAIGHTSLAEALCLNIISKNYNQG
jgi:hypothetical protein